MNCGISVIKYLLFLFNLICASFIEIGFSFLCLITMSVSRSTLGLTWLCGIVFIVIGSIFISHVYSFKEFIHEIGAQQIPIGFIVLGSLIFIIAFFGCCGAIRESYCMSMTYAIALFILIVLDIALIVYVFVARANQEELVTQAINKLWISANQDASAFKGLQAALQCCGKTGPINWAGITLPKSCCRAEIALPSCTIAESYTVGCEQALKQFIQKNIDIIGYVGICIAAIEMIGFIFACCLANHIRNLKRRAAY